MTNYCNLFQKKFVISQNRLNNLQKIKNIICKNSLFCSELGATISLRTTSMTLLGRVIMEQGMIMDH
nr:MAG TPA: hypothetical protein [Caudoviricetes sp.]